MHTEQGAICVRIGMDVPSSSGSIESMGGASKKTISPHTLGRNGRGAGGGGASSLEKSQRNSLYRAAKKIILECGSPAAAFAPFASVKLSKFFGEGNLPIMIFFSLASCLLFLPPLASPSFICRTAKNHESSRISELLNFEPSNCRDCLPIAGTPRKNNQGLRTATVLGVGTHQPWFSDWATKERHSCAPEFPPAIERRPSVARRLSKAFAERDSPASAKKLERVGEEEPVRRRCLR